MFHHKNDYTDLYHHRRTKTTILPFVSVRENRKKKKCAWGGGGCIERYFLNTEHGD